ncbi:MAG: type II toxin-antitoxin system CcdA family antitoxin [Rhodopila sp.]
MSQQATPRQPCNLSLPADLVQQARRYTSNLSGTVEELLAAWTARAAADAQADAERTQRLVAGLERLRNEVGSLADDFPPL